MNKLLIVVLLASFSLLACTPKVEVGLSDKPINININAKIDHEVRVRVERDVENLFEDNKNLF